MRTPILAAGLLLLLCFLLNGQFSSSTTISSIAPAAPLFGQTVTLTAQVSPPPVSGTVAFMDGGVLVGIGTLNSSGIAQITTITLAAGVHSIRAVYSSGCPPSQSAVSRYVVTAVPGAGFAAEVNYALAGNTVPFAAVGDFNRDGKADLAVADWNSGGNSGQVAVMLGNGDGTFQAPVNYAAGAGAGFIAVGDFNADGNADLVVATLTGVSVLLGTGNGSFQAAGTYATGMNAVSVVVGDFNADGKADLAVANFGAYNTSDVSVLLGNGDGTFQPAVNYGTTGADPGSIAAGDFNGDGKPDLAVANIGGVNILLGNGDGTFQRAMNYAGDFLADSVAVGDFNGDGKPDLAVAENGSSGNVSVLLGNGDGTFRTAVNYSVGPFPMFVVVEDFNGDGKTDLAVAAAGGIVSVLLDNGNGVFQPAANYDVSSAAFSLAVGDFNGDGRVDLVVANGTSVGVLLGMGGIPSGPPTSITLMSTPNPSQYGQPVTLMAELTPPDAGGQVEFLDGTTAVGIGTLNLSGQAQMTTSLLDSGASSLRVLYDGVPGVWQASQSSVVNQMVNPVAASGFAAAVNYPTGTNPISLVVGDFNGDGKTDLIVASQSGDSPSVLLGRGDGTFQATATNLAGADSMAVGDFNGDGKADLVFVNELSVKVLLGNGDATFQAALIFPAGTSPLSVAVADLNGDGKMDLIVANASTDNNVSELLGNGDGTFQAPVNYTAGTSPVSVAVGDFNGDGKADLAVAGQTVSVLLGNGNGSFQAAVSYAAGFDPSSVAVGDFNGDGTADLAVANESDKTVSVLLGNGDGTFQPAVSYGAGSEPRSVVVGDLNGDGKADLAVANFIGNTVSVLLGNGDGTFQGATNYPAGSGPRSLTVVDFNGDGRADFAFANYNDNTVSVLLGSNTGAPFHSPFFSGEVSLGSGVYYLQFPDGNLFGYYNYQAFPILYHYDLGFEYFLEANDAGAGAYLYDFAGGHWFYTCPSLFPYLNDFTLNNWLYYFPAIGNTTNPRYFSNLGTGKIFTM